MWGPRAVAFLDERIQIASVEDTVGDKGGEGDVFGCAVLFGDTTRAFDERASRWVRSSTRRKCVEACILGTCLLYTSDAADE